MMFKEKSHAVLVTGLTWSKAEQNRATGWEAYSQDFITINGDEDYGPGPIMTDFWDHRVSLMRLWWTDKRCPRSSLEVHLGIPWISLYCPYNYSDTPHITTTEVYKGWQKTDVCKLYSASLRVMGVSQSVLAFILLPLVCLNNVVKYLQFLPLWQETQNQAFVLNLHYIHSWA